jgi:hypothetical protein
MPETLSQVRQTDSSIFAALVSLRHTLAPTLAFMSAANDETANFYEICGRGMSNCPWPIAPAVCLRMHWVT